ncbi:M23 family metallopeptidase [Saccharopolyspora sp. NPDC049357]|uniref:M23 family metallopeptidase n=1 Tax=Saccharopolyspora sp. NPDC049357 TaxID=3154507 RepID=UPI00343B387C
MLESILVVDARTGPLIVDEHKSGAGERLFGNALNASLRSNLFRAAPTPDEFVRRMPTGFTEPEAQGADGARSENTMALRRRPVLNDVLGFLITAGLCAGGITAATVAVQDAHPERNIPAVREVAHTAAVPPIESGPPAPRPDPWLAPTRGVISSGFEMRWGEMHKGVDIANNVGTPIRAASAGTVIDSGPASGYGLWIRIAHPNDTVSTYGHIDSAYVPVGRKVQSGDLIAAMGNRGQSTGPHLHFQIEIKGQAVDPVSFYGEPRLLTHWPAE